MAAKKPAKKVAKKPAKKVMKTPAKKRRASKKAAGKPKRAGPAAPAAGRIAVENVNVPGYRNTVDAAKYEAMHATLLDVIPKGPPGITQAQMMAGARAKAPRSVFPGGDKTEWWAKTVHLDQEAKGTMKRSDTRPLRWWRVG